jgi:hypothetical protein
MLRRLSFTGPGKEDACLEFHSGLNIIYGASDSGKSFILESIAFMLGGGSELRDIPERVGYDRIWLTLARPDGSLFTITRSPEGGDYLLYEGELREAVPNATPTILKEKHDAKKSDNLSSYLLGLVGAQGKKLKSKADGKLISFTASHMRHLGIVSETDIQKQGSPIVTGQFTSATAEMSAFKFLLTGVDDSGLVKSSGESSSAQSRQAKREVLEEILISYQAKWDRMANGEVIGDELEGQLRKLEQSLFSESESLKASESDYAGISQRRMTLRQSIERSLERQAEIADLLERFNLLNEHYSSDIRRLQGIHEAGSLVAALLPGKCPLCGSDGSRLHEKEVCDGNLDVVVVAAAAEREKVVALRADLAKTISKLQREAESFERLLPELQQELSNIDAIVANIVPSLTDQRSSYETLVERRAAVRSMHELWAEIADLNDRKSKLEDTLKPVDTGGSKPAALPASVIDEFSQKLEKTLQEWKFPNATRVHFDSPKKDFSIAGKLRGSRGKGMRAITHAAFTIALLEFCHEKSRPNLGFVVMDSPLLAYREPDAADEGIADTGIDELFYLYLSKIEGRQVIIIENVDPPYPYSEAAYSTRFTGNSTIGRAGFFPQ